MFYHFKLDIKNILSSYETPKQLNVYEKCHNKFYAFLKLKNKVN